MQTAELYDFRRESAEQIRITARHYRTLADDLDVLADEKAAYSAYYRPNPPSRSRDALVALEMQRGHRLPRIIETLTSDGFSAGDVRFLFHYLRPKMAARQKRRRDLYILRLWKLKKSDGEIATAAEVTKRTVQRVISKARRAGY